MSEGAVAESRARWRDYLEVSKPRVVALMIFTAAVGMFLASKAMVPWTVLVFGLAGIAMVAASAAAINHLFDLRIDALMARTRRRPLPRGALHPHQVLLYATGMGVLGTLLLARFTNASCTALTLASSFGYAVIYTMYLKRATPHNIVIGGAAGAAPPLLGWVAVTGHADVGALALFLIIFAWTPSHFWALAIHRRDDYAKAGIPMMPVTHGVRNTARQILVYTLVLFGAALLPAAIGMAGALYVIVAVLAGARFVVYAWRLYFASDLSVAMPMFRYSITYLGVLFATLLIDHYR
ncbi:MAG TPA: heme o synthase [Casimicrobiaceae bacterium]|nr:heme o synthase [Casimicrobiaceae bacterium]